MSTIHNAIDSDTTAWYRRSLPVLYVLLVALSVAAAFVYKLRVEGLFACPAGGYGNQAYMSECHASSYGDYDHGAFWFGLEPQARRAAVEAQVLMIGNSRLQFALSGAEAAQWFGAAGLRHYLLGFSHSETVMFFTPLLADLQPRARAYVVNVDRLFEDRITAPAEQILRTPDARSRYQDKQAWQPLHRSLCGALPALCGQALAVYRTRESGAWQRLGTAPFEGRAVSEGAPSRTDQWPRFTELGRQFVAALPVDRRCVILTLVPTVETKRDEAKAIAASLGLELVSPQLEGLRTFDGSHLDEASAQRWAAAFLDAAGPRLRECAKAPAGKG